MKLYKCIKCNSVYLEADLIKPICSENMVGSYVSPICPKCNQKGIFSRLTDDPRYICDEFDYCADEADREMRDLNCEECDLYKQIQEAYENEMDKLFLKGVN